MLVSGWHESTQVINLSHCNVYTCQDHNITKSHSWSVWSALWQQKNRFYGWRIVKLFFACFNMFVLHYRPTPTQKSVKPLNHGWITRYTKDNFKYKAKSRKKFSFCERSIYGFARQTFVDNHSMNLNKVVPSSCNFHV